MSSLVAILVRDMRIAVRVGGGRLEHDPVGGLEGGVEGGGDGRVVGAGVLALEGAGQQRDQGAAEGGDHQAAGSLAGVLDFFEVWLCLRRGGFEQQVAVSLDDHHQVVEVVGHSAGQPSDCFKPC